VDGCCGEGFLFQGRERRLGEDERKGGGLKEMGLGLGFFFFVFFSNVSKLPSLLYVLETPIYKQKCC
jgi:hypothetical protein